MTGHPAEGVLRRSLDEPFAVSDGDHAHLASCPRCAGGVQAAVRDREVAAAALAGHEETPRVDLDAAWSGLTVRLAGDLALDRVGDRPGPQPQSAAPTVTLAGARPAPGPRRLARWAGRPVAVAVAAGLVVVGGTAAAAAADWLPIFRAEKVAAIRLSASDLARAQVGLWADLSAYGEVSMPAGPGLTAVDGAAAATAATSVPAPRVGALPTGVEGSPQFHVLTTQTVTFTFSAAKAARSATVAGTALPPMPAGLDGTRLRIDVGPGIVETWTQHSGVPTLAVARLKSPTAATQGAALAVVRDYLLSMPGISPVLAGQIRAVLGDGTTLPIPVPQSVATASSADVGGAAATVLETTDGLGAGVVWVEHGELDAVLGPLTRDEVLGVARGLR